MKHTSKIRKVKEMTENIIKLDIKSFQDMCKQIIDLKARCKELSEENLFLRTENADLKFTRNFLGIPMTPEEVAVDEAESRYDFYTGDDF